MNNLLAAPSRPPLRWALTTFTMFAVFAAMLVPIQTAVPANAAVPQESGPFSPSVNISAAATGSSRPLDPTAGVTRSSISAVAGTFSSQLDPVLLFTAISNRWLASPALSYQRAGLVVSRGYAAALLSLDDPFIGGVTVYLDPVGVSTFAGTGTQGYSDGAPNVATFSDPSLIEVRDNYAYVVDGDSIRRVDRTTGYVDTWVGDPATPGCDDNSDPSLVRFTTIAGMTSDSQYLYVMDSCTDGAAQKYKVIRRINLTTGSTDTITDPSGVKFLIASGGSLTTAPDGYLYSTYADGDRIDRIDITAGTSSQFANLDTWGGKSFPITADDDSLWVQYYLRRPRSWRIVKVALSDASITQVVPYLHRN